MDLIDGEVVLALQVAWISGVLHISKRLVVGSVGCKTSNHLVTSSVLEDFGEDWSNCLEVVVPT
jgi:hypothetical protein